MFGGDGGQSGEVFHPSLRIAAENLTKIYFFDSGRLKFYRAELKEVCSSAAGDSKKKALIMVEKHQGIIMKMSC